VPELFPFRGVRVNPFDCELTFYVRTHRGHGYARRRVSLPFVPAAGVELMGFAVGPEDDQDCADKVVRLVWMGQSGKFLVVLDGFTDETCDEPPGEVVLDLWGEAWSFEELPPWYHADPYEGGCV
jgi:hypothetical protein